ncbi:hypothetical protein LguiA_001871 [Lonicera macranthoides]
MGKAPSSTRQFSNLVNAQKVRRPSRGKPPAEQTISFPTYASSPNLRNFKFGSFSSVVIGSSVSLELCKDILVRLAEKWS